ncbi:helix-turn-helix transcriptional regulator [Actinoplanes sp. TBRC 11911]|uniref:helix-turn-helix domain-containing protein n=1 Tax=Actinoplanes sp. TBRC 11911 TaxID=2729386 RepID=UPI00145F6428|nr:helix-turn-helix transcriptional regulator [Actinoplanes sp. TBRC 11911]NMO53644.1 helix-turn-helix transcriptional regulator [Actinoplanes sp. TBRC 11911]
MLVAQTVQEVLLLGGGALVLTGGPGEGKTTLAYAVSTVPGNRRVIAVPGHADESSLPYAATHRLLTRLSECPSTPRGGVRPHPDAGLLPRDALGAARVVLDRLAAADRPVLLLLDDAHLLDAESRRLFTLVAHRLDGVRAAILATAPAPLPGLPHLRLSPLTRAESRTLLHDRAPGLADDVAASLIDLAGGNPAALVELAAALSPRQRRGLADPPATLPPSSRLRQRFRAEVAALPPGTRDLLLLAAAAPELRPADVTDPAALTPAERAGLVSVHDDTIAFTPPLLRSLIYHDAPLADRHHAHRRLADNGSLLHRAQITPAPDDALARALTAAARHATPDRAARAHLLAAGLFDSRADKAGAVLAAARAAADAGRPHEATRLLRRLGREQAPAVVRNRARALTARLTLHHDPAAARDVLLDVATELLPHDPQGALEALLAAGDACGHCGDPGDFPAVARHAAAHHRDTSDPQTRLAVHHLCGLADLLTGADDQGFGHLHEVLRLAGHVTDPALLIAAAADGILTGRDRCAATLAGRAAALGTKGQIPAALEVAAFAEFAAGRYDAATDAALDGAAVAGRPGAHHALLSVLAALRGDRASMEPASGGAIRDAAGHYATGEFGDWAAGLLDLVEGRRTDALARLFPLVTGHGSPILRIAVTPHLIEAGAPGDVAGPFDRWAARTGESSWLALRARCRALTASTPDDADDLFREAIGWHRRDGAAFPAAHTALLYGRHLRRCRRHVEAREHLRRAAETFRRLDAAPWADQATHELRAAGESAGGEGAAAERAPATELTAQQQRIAGLVADGATNREVAQHLHLSPRTVDHHLRNVFARLGVRSRTELARLVATGRVPPRRRGPLDGVGPR